MGANEQHRALTLQNAALEVIGRVTAILTHRLNNYLQAIQGFLTLAQEDINDPAEVKSYLEMGQKETERVYRVVRRMRQLYRPQAGPIETLSIRSLIDEVLELVREEALDRTITFQLDVPGQLQKIKGVSDQLYLFFLMITLILVDELRHEGGGQVTVKATEADHSVNLFFIASQFDSSTNNAENSTDRSQNDHGTITQTAAALISETLKANGGDCSVVREDYRVTFQLTWRLH